MTCKSLCKQKFSQKTDFNISCKLHEKSKPVSLKKNINLSSAEFVHRVFRLIRMSFALHFNDSRQIAYRHGNCHLLLSSDSNTSKVIVANSVDPDQTAPLGAV